MRLGPNQSSLREFEIYCPQPAAEAAAISKSPLRGLERSTLRSFSRSPAAAGSRPVALSLFHCYTARLKPCPPKTIPKNGIYKRKVPRLALSRVRFFALRSG